MKTSEDYHLIQCYAIVAAVVLLVSFMQVGGFVKRDVANMPQIHRALPFGDKP